jgi:MFS family permease
MNSSAASAAQPWYHGVTRYQWLVLIVASLGWVFDAFEGQLYNLTRGDMLPDLLRAANPALSPEAMGTLSKVWGERFLGIFLIGGTLGGWIFSSLADRWGRKPVMVLTILFYSIFSGLTAFATELWHVGALRFLVAMGVGGRCDVGRGGISPARPGAGWGDFPREQRGRGVAGGGGRPRGGCRVAHRVFHRRDPRAARGVGARQRPGT